MPNRTNRTKNITFRRTQGPSSIKPNMWVAGDERIIGKPRINGCVVYDQRRTRFNDVTTKGHFARRLRRLKAVASLEPLPLLIDERHQPNWHPNDKGGQFREAIEGCFTGGVEDSVRLKGGKSFALVVGCPWGSHGVEHRGSSVAGSTLVSMKNGKGPHPVLVKQA